MHVQGLRDIWLEENAVTDKFSPLHRHVTFPNRHFVTQNWGIVPFSRRNFLSSLFYLLCGEDTHTHTNINCILYGTAQVKDLKYTWHRKDSKFPRWFIPLTLDYILCLTSEESGGRGTSLVHKVWILPKTLLNFASAGYYYMKSQISGRAFVEDFYCVPMLVWSRHALATIQEGEFSWESVAWFLTFVTFSHGPLSVSVRLVRVGAEIVSRSTIW